jgi:hypothetical protein
MAGVVRLLITLVRTLHVRLVWVRLSGRVSGLIRDGEFDLEQDNDPVPVETRRQHGTIKLSLTNEGFLVRT